MFSGSFLVTFYLFLKIPVTFTTQTKCIDNLPPFSPEGTLNFCRAFSDFGCCNVEQDLHVKEYVETEWAKLNSDDRDSTYCYEHFKNLTCLQCSPHSFDLYLSSESDGNTNFRANVGLCGEFCHNFYTACPEVADRLLSEKASSSNAATFCAASSTEDEDTCYPDLSGTDTGEPLGELDCVCIRKLAEGLRNPLVLTHPRNGSGRFFVAEHLGVVKVIDKNENGKRTLLEEPFLDIQDRVFTTDTPGDERGLLGLAFHPRYHSNGHFYVYYSARTTDENSDHISKVSRFSVSEEPNKADPDSEKVILEIKQPGAGQNGGQLLFDNDMDDYLYITVGYGGADEETATDKSNLLGSVLRIDVGTEDDDSNQYSIPPDNPFVGDNDARPEVYAYGFRNPWRCSIDAGSQSSTKMFCGDVGDSTAEEIDLVEKGGYYGWYFKEGNLCRRNSSLTEECIDPGDVGVDDIAPIHYYEHTAQTGYVNAVVGGFVYRGCNFPNLQGLYVYADYVLGKLWFLKENPSSGESWLNFDLCFGDDDVCNHGYEGQWENPHFILAFGEDDGGELYMMATTNPSNTAATGIVYQIMDPSRRSDPDTCSTIDSITIGDEDDIPIATANQMEMPLLTVCVLLLLHIVQQFDV
ncbi:HHIP-like protein 1 [Ptychodera flava]|uniref:HHIP-like protein 1 n=1 Tax=Ptychodera flava TaxID=63121 RepID=UPI00396A89BB